MTKQPITDINQLDASQTYTYADYLTWQFEEMVELIKGKLFKMSPAPSSYHQELSSNLMISLGQQLHKRKCKLYHAPFDVRLPSQRDGETIYTVVQPDICIICDVSKIDKKGCFGAPDLVVEILSPSTAKKDVKDKLEVYEESGVPEYWIIHPEEQTLLIHTLDATGRYQPSRLLTKGDVVEVNAVKGLTIDLDEVFTPNEYE